MTVVNDPPLVDLKVTNPVTYIRSWWKKVIGNEGIELKLKIRPLTTLLIAVVVTSIALGVGKFVIINSAPFVKYESYKSSGLNIPTPTQDPWRETGFTGTVQYSEPTGRFYLVTTSSSEAIALELPENINLTDYIGKRIFATGKYNKNNRTLVVSVANDLEVLSKKPTQVPTTTPLPTVTTFVTIPSDDTEINPLN